MECEGFAHLLYAPVDHKGPGWARPSAGGAAGSGQVLNLASPAEALSMKPTTFFMWERNTRAIQQIAERGFDLGIFGL